MLIKLKAVARVSSERRQPMGISKGRWGIPLSPLPSPQKIQFQKLKMLYFSAFVMGFFKCKMQSSQVNISPKVRIGDCRAVFFLGGMGAWTPRKSKPPKRVFLDSERRFRA